MEDVATLLEVREDFHLRIMKRWYATTYICSLLFFGLWVIFLYVGWSFESPKLTGLATGFLLTAFLINFVPLIYYFPYADKLIGSFHRWMDKQEKKEDE